MNISSLNICLKKREFEASGNEFSQFAIVSTKPWVFPSSKWKRYSKFVFLWHFWILNMRLLILVKNLVTAIKYLGLWRLMFQCQITQFPRSVLVYIFNFLLICLIDFCLNSQILPFQSEIILILLHLPFHLDGIPFSDICQSEHFSSVSEIAKISNSSIIKHVSPSFKAHPQGFHRATFALGLLVDWIQSEPPFLL